MCGYHVLRRYHPSGPQPLLPVHGPAETADRLARGYDLDPDPGMREEFDFRIWGEPVRIGPFHVEAIPVDHPVDAFGVRSGLLVVPGLLALALVALLVAYRPVAGLLVFILPMLMGLFLTAWATHDHHAGLKTDDDYTASYNNLNPLYNLLTGNLGYHTAHHLKGGLHWSKLPRLHEKIKHKIPDELIVLSLVT